MQEKLRVRIGADTTGFKSGLKGATDFAVSSAKKIVFAFAGLVTASALVGSKFEKEITNTATIAQAFGKDLDALEKKARSIGKTTAFTASEAAKGMYDLASAGLKTREIIDATESAMLLAGATASEMTQATNLLASSLSQFGMDAKESRRIVDTFASAITNSLLTMDKLTEAMKYAGTTGAAFKWSIEQTTAAVAMFTNLGLEGSMSGTNLRMSMLTLSSQTQKVTDTLEELGLTFREVNPETHTFGEILDTLGKKSIDSRQAVELFGARAGLNMKQLINLAKMGLIDYDAFVKKLVESQEGVGRTAEMYERMQSKFSGAFKRFWSAIQELGITTFDLYKEEGKKMFDDLAKQINAFSDLINKNARSIKEAMYDTALVAVDAFSMIVRGIGFAIKGLESMKGVILVIKGAFNEIRAKGIESVILPGFKKESALLSSELESRKRYNLQGEVIGFNEPTIRSKNATKEQLMSTKELAISLSQVNFKIQEYEQTLTNINKGAIDSNIAWEGTLQNLKAIDDYEAKILKKINEWRNVIVAGKKEIGWGNLGTLSALGGSLLPTDQRQLGALTSSLLPTKKDAFSFNIPDISTRTFKEELMTPRDEAEMERQKKLSEFIKSQKEKEIQFIIQQMEEEKRLKYEALVKEWNTQKEFSQKFRDVDKDSYRLRMDEVERERQHYLAVLGNNKQMEIDINALAEKEITKIKAEETKQRLSLLESEFGKVAATAKNILDMSKGSSKEAWGVYKAFAIAEATISGIKSVMSAYTAGSDYGPAAAYAFAGVAAGFAATQIAMIKAAEPPSYDQGGVSTKPGIYYSGVPEAHIPLKGGKVPVQLGGGGGRGGNSVVVRLENPVFQDAATQRRTMRMIAEEITMRLAPSAINSDYNNDGRMRKIIRSRG